MAEIALRDYLAEIDSLIEGNSYDEAIAHCRHILTAYPKCLEVYRLLGKAALEKEDDKAAIDIFQRVLSVDPEDFVARVGLSIVYDRQGQLDDALWHMERGFELMPSNDVIQSELRRLYGMRDGVEPERIALTRGALARMYAQGDLYDEAVAELRALIKDSPERVDLQILLAETLWLNEQRNEAASVAERILDRYPHCLNASLILGEIWLNSGFSEDGEMLLRRAQGIDPDNMRAGSLLGAAAPLSEQTTLVNRLEYQSQYAPAAEPESDQVPDWLAGLAGMTTLDQPESAGLPGLPPPSPGPAIELGPSTDMPEWLVDLDQAMPAPEARAEPETPDWMKSMWEQPAAAEAPAIAAGPAGPSEPELPEPTGAATPDWLAQFGEMAAAPTEEAGAEPAGAESASSEALPDWLSRIGEPIAPAPAEAPEPEPAEPAADLPDWLSEIGAPAEETAQGGLDTRELEHAELPEWLQAMRPPVSEPLPHAVELPEVEESEMPEWMSELEEAPATDTALEFLHRLGESALVELEEPGSAALEPADTSTPETVAPESVEMPPAVPPVMPTGPEPPPAEEAALDFLRGLTVGQEDELRVGDEQETEALRADVTGRAPETPTPAPSQPPVIELPPASAASRPEDTDKMPSPEDALAFLQSLAAGKEDQLREEAERAADERMDAIMGGKPGTSPLRPSTKPLQPPAPEPVVPPSDDLLSPEDALAFLHSLTVGKEDQLREAAERAADERMDAIMGGKPGTSPLRPSTKPLAAQPEPEPKTIESLPADEVSAADDALAFLENLTTPSQPSLIESKAPVIEMPGRESSVGAVPPAEPAFEESPPAEPAGVMEFWLQTADDEGGQAITDEYFERALMPQPVVSRQPAATQQPERVAPPVPSVPPIGADELHARLQSDPADHEARLGLARVYWASGDQAQALQFYQELADQEMFLGEVAADLQRNLESFEHADWYRTLGDVQMKLGHLAQALDAYRQALTRL